MKFSTEGLEGIISDTSAELEGIRVHIEGPVYFILRRAGGANKQYDRARARYVRQYRRLIDRMDEDEIVEKVVKPAYLDAVIVDWEGVRDEKGKEVPYSRGACQEWFKAFPNAWQDVWTVAQTMEAFKQQEVQEVAEQMGES